MKKIPGTDPADLYVIPHPKHPWERLVVRTDDQAIDPTAGQEDTRASDPDLWASLVQRYTHWERGSVYRVVLQCLRPVPRMPPSPFPGALLAEWFDFDVVTEQYLDLDGTTPQEVAAEHWEGWDTPPTKKRMLIR